MLFGSSALTNTLDQKSSFIKFTIRNTGYTPNCEYFCDLATPHILLIVIIVELNRINHTH